MMTRPMDNGNSDHLSRERAQRLYNKNVELERKYRKAAQARVPSDPNTWQQMRENYEAIILEDHGFSEQHEIEYALWQLHYKRIEELRSVFSAALASARSSVSQSEKGPTRPRPDRVAKIRNHFKTFLSEATGFYHDLILKVKAKYGLPLEHFSDDSEGQIGLFKDGNNSEIKKGLISCHRCFIYLGDLARYKGLYGEGDAKVRHFAAASSYYTQASSLWSSSGNPHHQLAILASYSGDELVVIYRYFRSLAVTVPFTTARDNLIIAFEKNRHGYTQLHGNPNSSTPESGIVCQVRGESQKKDLSKDNGDRGITFTKEKMYNANEAFKAFCTRFVRLNGILFTRTSLETFSDVLSVVKSDLLSLLSSGIEEEHNFGSDASECKLVIIRLVAMLIFTIYNLNKETENKSYAEILQRSVLLQNAYTAVFECMGHIVQRCVQLNDPTASYLLPGIMVFLEWLACCQDIAVDGQVEAKQASARSFFWTHCLSFFNKLLSSTLACFDGDGDESCFFNMSRYDEGETANRLALSEDIELRGFLPLLPAQLILDFSRKHFGTDSGIKETRARIQRIIAAGKALASLIKVGDPRFRFDIKLKRFVIAIEPQINDESHMSPWEEGSELDESRQEHVSSEPLQPNIQFYAEGDEEEEVIVFKPSVNEKLVNGTDAKQDFSAVHVSGASASKIDLGDDGSSSSPSCDDSIPWNAFQMSSRTTTLVSSIAAPYLQPIHPSTSKWPVEQGAMVNGLGNLNILENNYALRPELQNHVPSTALSVPHFQSNTVATGNKYPVQAQDYVTSPKYDLVVSSRVGVDNLAKKSSSVMSAVSKKNPVSRPVRHLGPPPGFGTNPPKAGENSLPASKLSNGNPLMDDYRWLDGYQFPSSNQSIQFDTFIDHAEVYHPVSSSDSSIGMENFPFPGKQTSVLHVQAENQKGWQENHVPEHMNLYQEQHHHLQHGNEQSLPQQYHGQSLWEGRFFV